MDRDYIPEKKACSEWLYLDFDYYKLVYFYNSCEKCGQLEEFIKTLESLLVHKGIFSEIEELDIERFWREKRKAFTIDIDTKWKNSLSQNHNFRGRRQEKTITYLSGKVCENENGQKALGELLDYFKVSVSLQTDVR